MLNISRLAKPTLHAHYASPLGPMVLATAGNELIGVWFDDQADRPSLSCSTLAPQDALLQQTQAQLNDYFAGRRQTFKLPLNLRTGTVFQNTVWQALLTLAPGHTCSYSTLASQIGRPTAQRALGGAVGRNPISIIVPCHRVMGAGGQLTGYSGGLWRKTALLQLEGVL